MGLPKTIQSYTDIRNTLDAALAAGAARMRTATPGQATYWRLRANQFRKLLRHQLWEAAGSVPGHNPETPYDSIVLTLDGPDVVIENRLIHGVLLTADGKEEIEVKRSTPTEAVPAENSALHDEALDLVEEIGEG